jgi:hypothetical protein
MAHTVPGGLQLVATGQAHHVPQLALRFKEYSICVCLPNRPE